MLRLLGAAFCALSLTLLACGDDEDESEEDAGPAGEPCPAPGIGDNNCVCSSAQPKGYRECRQNRTWSDCECAPAGTQDTCTSGQPVRCTPCPPDYEERIIKCDEDNTFDCSCPDDEDERDAG